MAATINSNILSLNAQRNLTTSQTSLSTSVQRLSSGLRINSAKDDAAGLAISERFSTQIRGLNQAVRNANDGISLAQTAEGALASIGNNLQRIRELAVQSRNATNSDTDRSALQAEVAQLKEEIDRVANQTSFNGTKLLDGSFTAKVFQVGADQGQTISINNIADANIAALGNWTSVATAASAAGAAPTGAVTGGTTTPASAGTASFAAANFLADFTTTNATFEVTIDGAATPTTVTLNTDYTAGGATLTDVATDITTALAGAGVATYDSGTGDFTITSATTGATSTVAVTNFTGVTAPTVTAVAGADASTTGGTTTFAAIGAGELVINGQNITVAAATSATARGADLAAAINANTAANVIATVNGTTGALTLTSKDTTSSIVIGSSLTATALTEVSGLTAGTSAAIPGTAQTGFSSLNISTTAGADDAILAMDAALTTVNSARADLGAIQNRFSSVVDNLSITAENLTASRSRIMDADFAAETAALSRAQILQQAGTAMVAQANQLPQGVLALLR